MKKKHPIHPEETARGKACDASRQCGACSHVNMPYNRQLRRKQDFIAHLFDEVAGKDCVLEPILGMETPFRFRNKIVSPFAPGKRAFTHKGEKRKGDSAGRIGQREILHGMYAAGTHKIVPLDDCPVEHECGRRIVRAVAQLMRKYGIAPYNEDAGTGFMRHVVVRVGHESGEVLVTLVTNGSQFPGAKSFARELVKRCPEITTVVQNVNTRQTNAIFGNEEHVIYGPGFILDTLCGLSFRISSHSFYQVNAVQTEVLYLVAIRWALESDTDGVLEPEAQEEHGLLEQGEACESGVRTNREKGCGDDALDGGSPPNRPLAIMDAYCGTGTIGLVAASMAGNAQVVGVDKVESAIRDARQNALHNGIENATFVAGDAGPYLRLCAAEGRHFDVLLMDPPRAGATEEFLRAAAESKVRRIVYISCNPRTQLRDVEYLQRFGYRLKRIQAVDMFPHTDHVETVVLLSKM